MPKMVIEIERNRLIKIVLWLSNLNIAIPEDFNKSGWVKKQPFLTSLL